jgi:hypothetical protein
MGDKKQPPKKGAASKDKSASVFNQRAFLTAMSSLVSRASLASRLGYSYSGDRDLYTALGWIKTPDFDDYNRYYLRNAVGKRVVNAPVSATWRDKPVITDGAETKTFEEEWTSLAKKHRIWDKFTRVDKMAGIHQFAILLLGFDDEKKLSEPVEKANELLYIHPYSENSVKVQTWEDDTTSSRFGLPLLYNVKISQDGSGNKTTSQLVHYTRVLHVAEGLLESNTYGTPRMEAAFNNVMDAEKITGGSAEMFWRGAFQGISFEADKDVDFDAASASDMATEVDEYIHGLKRYMRLQGIKANPLSPEIEEPTAALRAQIEMVSIATGIPVRILTGSERGELASSQDERNWAQVIEDRQQSYAEPVIIRPFIDQLIDLEILPEPDNGEYVVIWEDLFALGAKEEAEIGELKTKALKNYVDSMGAEMVLPIEKFLGDIMGFTPEEIQQITESVGAAFEDEET